MKCLTCGADAEANAQFCGVCGARVDVAPQDPFLGRTMSGRYQIDSKLGEGGFGAVYRGRHVTNQRPVAIKVLHPSLTSDENLVARFEREGLVMCKLRDPHVVTTYEFERAQDGTLFIAMELLSGRSLQDVLDNEAPIDWRRLLKIVVQVCDALEEAHGQGIVHRDLKPENIHLEARGEEKEFVKVLDFGIAKVVSGGGGPGDGLQLTAAGQTLGTLEYMSPEQLMGRALTGASDIYTMGVVCYELLTRQLPFPDAKGPAALITAQINDDPQPPSSVISSIPAPIDQLILAMLHKTPDGRLATAKELRSRSHALLEGGATAPVAVAQPLPQPASGFSATIMAEGPLELELETEPVPPRGSSQAAPTTAPVTQSGGGGGRAIVWLLLALIAIGGGVAAYFLTR